MTTTLYSAVQSPHPDMLAIGKWDEDLNLIETYIVGPQVCTCPAGERPSCKHRAEIRPLFLKYRHVGDGWFLDWSTRLWRHPTGDVAEAIKQAIADQAASLNGKTAPFEGEDTGSSPVAATNPPPSMTSPVVVTPPPSNAAPLGGGEIKRRRIT